MKVSQALKLVSIKPPSGSRTSRRLERCRTIDDVRLAAKRRLPRPVFDYVDGGADGEDSLRNNTDALSRYHYQPRVLTDVSNPDISATILGRKTAAPLGFAPTGYTRMIDPRGEPAVARAAARVGIPYVLSTMASTSLEDLAGTAGVNSADLWFQLYVWKDRALTLDLVSRASASGYRVLEVAVDTAVTGNRLRDARNGLTIPPALSLRSLGDIGSRPGYWAGMLAGPALKFANVEGRASGYSVDNIGQLFDPGVTWEDLETLRDAWPGQLILKGPIGPADAKRAQSLGVDGVHLSNHGGRQLDRTLAPVDLVRPVRAAVGADFAILVDSGIRHGSDIATTIALGADACMVGRAYLWGLVAGGQDGVEHVAGLLTDQFRRTLQLLGMASVEELRAAGPGILSPRCV
ncbi:alpha-hydroxy-acid oxidizing protein [Paeniglutamicibacter antarcticus]|uniref:Alpha-hydroxy-acid oxidizing protein n=1 Tax=Arthrobacter terrae TaxID=2935737 RepID=A0A931GBR6_9MICC|nr:alpha-hydroxy acid oxidase [Arthrobacter terrae]MBG0741012.1 alpha-hydroxy-acid oxidizing protein [Arthrobacter terrae]